MKSGKNGSQKSERRLKDSSSLSGLENSQSRLKRVQKPLEGGSSGYRGFNGGESVSMN